MTRVEKLIRSLPDELQQKVEAYVEALIKSQPPAPSTGLTLKWRGDLRDLRGQFDSVQLQHDTAEQWGR
jgi:hypothetical protein